MIWSVTVLKMHQVSRRNRNNGTAVHKMRCGGSFPVMWQNTIPHRGVTRLKTNVIETRTRLFDSFVNCNGTRANICFSSYSGARFIWVCLYWSYVSWVWSPRDSPAPWWYLIRGLYFYTRSAADHHQHQGAAARAFSMRRARSWISDLNGILCSRIMSSDTISDLVQILQIFLHWFWQYDLQWWNNCVLGLKANNHGI